jgi:putative DNA primase/helicase
MANNLADDFPPAGRTTILVDKASFHLNAQLGEKALCAAECPLYRRDFQLVRPVTIETEASDGRTTQTAALLPVTIPILRQWLNEAADWVKHDARRRGRAVPTAPPHEVAELILHRVGDWPFPSIAGVITTPTVRRDGSLLIRPGYDRHTRLHLSSNIEVPSSRTSRPKTTPAMRSRS